MCSKCKPTRHEGEQPRRRLEPDSGNLRRLLACAVLPCLVAACGGSHSAVVAPVDGEGTATPLPAPAPALASIAPSASPAATASTTRPDTPPLVVTGSCFKKQEGQCLETPIGIEKSGCEAMGGTPLPGPCPTKDRIGTCRQLVQGIETAATHYYKGFTMASSLSEAKTFCESHSGTRQFVPAP
jgi:hypothetical protein